MKKLVLGLAVSAFVSAAFAADELKPATDNQAAATAKPAATDKNTSTTATASSDKSPTATASADADCGCGDDSCSLTKKVFLSPRAKEALRKTSVSGS